MRPLLPAICCLLICPAAAQTTKPRKLKINSNAALFEKLMDGLNARQLLKLYRTDLKLIRVTRNRHEPAVRDSLLQVKTPADRLTLFKNRYNAQLCEATITSTKVRFAGLHTRVRRVNFCQKLHLKPGYDQYVITDGVENFVQLTFAFAGGKLKNVEYRELLDIDAID